MQSDILPAGLPISDQLRASAIPLDHLGVHEVAWTRGSALDVISALGGTIWALLGGDVLVRCDGVFRHSYDSWHSDPSADEACPEFVERSHRESRTYIERFPEKAGSPSS
jgi:Immunity protein 40